MELTKTAITRPVFVLMAMLAIFVIGYLSYKSMRVEENPDVNLGVATVTTIYPGAGPDEVNTLVSRKIEDAVSGISNLQQVTATSQEGVSSVTLQFVIGTNMDVALNDVRTKVDATVGNLPKEAEKPVVDKFDFAGSPVFTLAMTSDRLSSRQVRDLIDNVIVDKFARIDGVAQVGVNGGDTREIQVQVKPAALVQYGIGIVDLQRAIANATVNVPSGRVVSGSQEYTVRLLGEFKTVADIDNMYVSFPGQRQSDPVRRVRLGDIATVKDTVQEVRTLSRVNQKDAIVVAIQKTKQGNAIEISKAITTPSIPDKSDPKHPKMINLLQQIERDYGVKSIVTNDTSTRIQESISDLNFTLVFSIILVAAVVWLFLHDWRGTLIVAIAIPVCIFATFIAMQGLGFTINNLSMLALSLAVGVLVDDAIVVLENIYRHLKMGEDPPIAALNGRGEIGLAAIAITLADVVVFLPIGNMGGIVGQFFRPLGIGYAVCVMFSLLVSFTVTPMLAARWYKAGEDMEHPTNAFARWFEHSFENLANWYRGVLRWSLHHRWYVFGGGFVALVAVFRFITGSYARDPKEPLVWTLGFAIFIVFIGFVTALINSLVRKEVKIGPLIGSICYAALFIVATYLGFFYYKWKGEDVFKNAFVPPTDAGLITINVKTPPDSSLAYTQSVVSRIEKVVMQNPETEFVVANIGTQGGGFSASSKGTQYAQITVTLRDKESIFDQLLPFTHKGGTLRKAKDTYIVSDFIKAIGNIPGAKVTVSASGSFSFGAAIQLSLRSEDREQLLATAVKLRDALQAGTIEGVVSPDISSTAGKQELRAVPNRARIAEANVTASEVGAAMRLMYEGDDTTKFRENGKEYPIRILMDLGTRDNPNLVNTVPITFRNNNPVYLSEIATMQNGRGIDKIDRIDRQETVTVTAELLPNFAVNTVQSKIDAWINSSKILPEGVTYKPLGQADSQARESGYLLGALGLGLILVYMILASLFDNLLYPLIIQLAQPQAMIGALLGLVLTDKTLNIVGVIGIIALIGLVGKNGILIVDYTNTLRGRGEEREEALIESGGTRLRPILMTTLALLVGMLPVALALGRGSEFRETIGITIIGGTLLSTLLSLLVIPCSYSIFDDFAGLFRKRQSRNNAALMVGETPPTLTD